MFFGVVVVSANTCSAEKTAVPPTCSPSAQLDQTTENPTTSPPHTQRTAFYPFFWTPCRLLGFMYVRLGAVVRLLLASPMVRRRRLGRGGEGWRFCLPPCCCLCLPTIVRLCKNSPLSRIWRFQSVGGASGPALRVLPHATNPPPPLRSQPVNPGRRPPVVQRPPCPVLRSLSWTTTSPHGKRPADACGQC